MIYVNVFTVQTYAFLGDFNASDSNLFGSLIDHDCENQGWLIYRDCSTAAPQIILSFLSLPLQQKFA